MSLLLWLLLVLLLVVVLFVIFTNPNKKVSLSLKEIVDVHYSKDTGFTIFLRHIPYGYTNRFMRVCAHIIQGENFFRTSFVSHKKQTINTCLKEMYWDNMNKKLKREKLYLTTGDPHSRAFYFRNFGVFYIDNLNPEFSQDKEQYITKISISLKSFIFSLEVFRNKSLTTTAISVGGKSYALLNYYAPPSDSLLGILTNIETLLFPEHFDFSCKKFSSIQESAQIQAKKLLKQYTPELRRHLLELLSQGKISTENGKSCFLLDSERNFSSSLDTHLAKKRFIVAANLFATLEKAVKLSIVTESEISVFLQESLVDYKSSLFSIFAKNGYIQYSLENQICVFDFMHTKNGFWNIKNRLERDILEATVNKIIENPNIWNREKNALFIAEKNIPSSFLVRFTVPSYQGKSMWPHYNVEFCNVLLDLYRETGNKKYKDISRTILKFLEEKIMANEGYPEVLDENGNLLSTWCYKSALAYSWLPRFKMVVKKARDPQRRKG